MENASKALLMAAGVLVGMIVLSMGVYLYSTLSGISSDVNLQMEMTKLSQFNEQFSVYLGRTDLTIYDIINIAELAQRNNIEYGFENSDDAGKDGKYYVTVKAQVNGATSLSDTEKLEAKVATEKSDWITNDINSITSDLRRYTCTAVDVSNKTKRVYKIEISVTP